MSDSAIFLSLLQTLPQGDQTSDENKSTNASQLLNEEL